MTCRPFIYLVNILICKRAEIRISWRWENTWRTAHDRMFGVGVDFCYHCAKNCGREKNWLLWCEGYAKEAGSSVCVTDSTDAVEGAGCVVYGCMVPYG